MVWQRVGSRGLAFGQWGAEPLRASLCAVLLVAAPWSASAATLINGDFEAPDRGTTVASTFLLQADVPGWSTTDTDIEIWSNGFNGVTSYSGTQHAEINAKAFGTLYQSVTGIAAGADVILEFAHRAREGTDVMRVDVHDLGADATFGTADDTLLFTRQVSATTASWVFTSSDSFGGITALGGDLRLSFTAVSTGSNVVSVGNFLDAVTLQAKIPVTPLPPAGWLMLGGFGLLGAWRRSKTVAGRTRGATRQGCIEGRTT
ncbi:MAG: PEP-CTERM sorting domain-containing protein [Pseudomonadota bacterium]